MLLKQFNVYICSYYMFKKSKQNKLIFWLSLQLLAFDYPSHIIRTEVHKPYVIYLVRYNTQ
jgi:hypothetical protein